MSMETMTRNFRGEVVYNADADHHFPHLTVKETLEFAAACRTARNRVISASRAENIRRVTEVALSIFGLTHVEDVKVGNDYVRGVSGGERKVKFLAYL
jgi:ATP-binding cassette, subfamily G (WHITE), member 2, PDR